MQTYKVEYEAIGDVRWRFFNADDFEDAAWKAKNWVNTNGYELINVKPIRVEET
tara:strand:- start:1949 stop:2110 length:162 start_codon:yes stop_codon:yes gene_type:complete